MGPNRCALRGDRRVGVRDVRARILWLHAVPREQRRERVEQDWRETSAEAPHT